MNRLVIIFGSSTVCTVSLVAAFVFQSWLAVFVSLIALILTVVGLYYPLPDDHHA